MNALSENVNFDSEFFLAFQRPPFKFSFFVSLKCQCFKIFADWMGYVRTLLCSERRKLQFFESFGSFAKEIDKMGQIQNFYSLSLTLLAWRVSGSGTQGCRGQIPLYCNHGGRACKEQCSFKENWMNLLKMKICDPEFVLTFEIQPFKIACFGSLKCQFFKVLLGLNGISKNIASDQMGKTAVFQKFPRIFKRNR